MEQSAVRKEAARMNAAFLEQQIAKLERLRLQKEVRHVLTMGVRGS